MAGKETPTESVDDVTKGTVATTEGGDATQATTEGGEGNGGAATASVPAAVKPAPGRDHRNDRIDQLTARVNELRKVNGDLTAKLAAKEPAKTAQELAEAEIERRAAEKAVLLAAEADWNRQCNEAVEAGKKQFSDFDQQLANLQTLLDKTDKTSVDQFTGLIAVAIDTGEAPTLIHKLGGDLDLAYKLMQLPPAKRAVEMTKLSYETKAALKALSTAEGGEGEGGEAAAANALTSRTPPKPITPIGNRAGPHTAIDPTDPARAKNLSSAEWHARRTAQVAEAMKQRQPSGRRLQ
jgi:hypothetical protein